MSEEERQALIEHAKLWIANTEEARDEIPFGFDEGAENELSLIRVALTALTAQPVKLPPRRSMLTRDDIDQDYVSCMAISVKDAITAIRAAGYEVQE